MLRMRLNQLVQHLNMEWNYELCQTIYTTKMTFSFIRKFEISHLLLPHITPHTLTAHGIHICGSDLGANESDIRYTALM